MIKIGILGLGTVGSGVVKIMDKNRGSISRKVGTGLEIEKILVNNPRKNRDIDVDPGLITDDINYIVDNPDIDLVVELIGGEEPAREYIIRAIKRSKSVVTANKLVIARHGQ
ncbi:MAG: homoserine dehydrogenase, partial [Bacillota bacterium]